MFTEITDIIRDRPNLIIPDLGRTLERIKSFDAWAKAQKSKTGLEQGLMMITIREQLNAVKEEINYIKMQYNSAFMQRVETALTNMTAVKNEVSVMRIEQESFATRT